MKKSWVLENNMFFPFCGLLFSFPFISYLFQAGHSPNIFFYLERQPCFFMLIYHPLHLLGNWIIYQFFFFLFSIVLLWIPKFLFTLFRRISLGYNHRSRISGSKLWTILKVSFHSNRFLFRKIELICYAKSNAQLCLFPHSLVNIGFKHFLSLIPCFANLGILRGTHGQFHKGEVTQQSYLVLQWGSHFHTF